MVNKFETRCCYCHGTVPANGGEVWKYRGRWVGAHLTCKAEKKAGVDTYVIGGKEYTRNARGRCIDAPCCGCCTI